MHSLKTILTFASLGLLLQSPVAFAQPKSGDVYREYTWHPSEGTGTASSGRRQRVTGPDATDTRSHVFLPNPINHIRLNDFQHATRAEMSLEMLQVHPGTKGHKVRLNGGSWLTIPTSSAQIPGNPLDYYSMRYPVVPLPLNALRNGDNSFQFTAKRAKPVDGKWPQWPQWMSYGVTVRIYYDEAAKSHPTGQITSHSNDATVGENEVFRASTSSSKPIKQVDFVGKYSDFLWKGDGTDRQWQDQTLYSKVRNHIGTDTRAPFNATWDNDWVPDQDQPMEVNARIVDNTGLTYVTPTVTGLKLDRPYSIKMYTSHDVPRSWSSRIKRTRSSKIDITDDLSHASAAKITMATWNGITADRLSLNNKFIRKNVGKNHDLSYDTFNVPLDHLKRNTNVFSTYATTTHHGIDVQWPGPSLFVRHELVPEPTSCVLLGLALTALFNHRFNHRSSRNLWK